MRTDFSSNCTGDNSVSTAVIGTNARSWAERLEAMETRRCGSADIARERLARRLGVAPGTLSSLRKTGRAKRIAADFYARLQAHFIRGLQDEIAQATHEIALARQAGLDPRETEMARLEAAVADAQALLNSGRAAE